MNVGQKHLLSKWDVLQNIYELNLHKSETESVSLKASAV